MKYTFVLLCLMLGLIILISPGINYRADDATINWEEAGCTVKIGPDESIQKTIDQTPAGSVIQLSEGIWKENIRINKAITLQGEGTGRTILNGEQKGYPTIWINSLKGNKGISVKVEGITITGAESQSDQASDKPSPVGVWIEGKVKVDITRCDITDNDDGGLELRGQAKLNLSDSTIHGNRDFGVRLQDTSGLKLSDCTINDNRFVGLLVGDSSQAEVLNTRIFDHQEMGIEIHDSSYVKISDSTIAQNEYGLLVTNSNQLIIHNSTISENIQCGISLSGSADISLFRNKIVHNWNYGIMLSPRDFEDMKAAVKEQISGKNNLIPGLGEPDGNQAGTIYPSELRAILISENIMSSEQLVTESPRNPPLLNSGLKYRIIPKKDEKKSQESATRFKEVVVIEAVKQSELYTKLGDFSHIYRIEGETTDEMLQLMEYDLLTRVFLRKLTIPTEILNMLTERRVLRLGKLIYFGWHLLRNMKYPDSVSSIHEKYLKATEPAGWYLQGLLLPNRTMIYRVFSKHAAGGAPGSGLNSHKASKLMHQATVKHLELLEENGIYPY